MIILAAFRFIRSVWLEARTMHREALRRFPHLRQD